MDLRKLERVKKFENKTVHEVGINNVSSCFTAYLGKGGSLSVLITRGSTESTYRYTSKIYCIRDKLKINSYDLT